MGSYDRGDWCPGNPTTAFALQLLSANAASKQPSEICDQKSCSVAGLYGLWVATCSCCRKSSLWAGEKLIYSPSGIGPDPNPDLPEDIRTDYEEARSIAAQSPRGAAALLRLCIQKLCKYLGEAGNNINGDIRSLIGKGLDPRIRVIGNSAVHPGQIDLRDDSKIVSSLFGLINIIAERMISHPQHIDNLYEALPESKKAQIAKRDGRDI
jgi:hypothetical protein